MKYVTGGPVTRQTYQVVMVFVIFVLVGPTVMAFATHKAWVLKNSGGQCVFEKPSATRNAYPGVIENTEARSVHVNCPVTLSARGGASSAPFDFFAPTWIAAKRARVFVNAVGTREFACRAQIQDVSGNMFYGASHFSFGSGYQAINLIDPRRVNDWGGSIGDLGISRVRKLEFLCIMPPGSAANPSQILGYDVAICQRDRDCRDIRSVDNRGSRKTVQGSGIECAPSTVAGAPHLRRSEYGIQNRGERPYSIHCPITPPADDSYEHPRTIYGASVYFSGSQPTCRYESLEQDGEKTTSPNFEFGRDFFFRGIMESVGTLDIGIEKSLSLQCDLPAFSTLEGYRVDMTVTRNSGGL